MLTAAGLADKSVQFTLTKKYKTKVLVIFLELSSFDISVRIFVILLAWMVHILLFIYNEQ